MEIVITILVFDIRTILAILCSFEVQDQKEIINSAELERLAKGVAKQSRFVTAYVWIPFLQLHFCENLSFWSLIISFSWWASSNFHVFFSAQLIRNIVLDQVSCSVLNLWHRFLLYVQDLAYEGSLQQSFLKGWNEDDTAAIYGPSFCVG